MHLRVRSFVAPALLAIFAFGCTTPTEPDSTSADALATAGERRSEAAPPQAAVPPESGERPSFNTAAANTPPVDKGAVFTISNAADGNEVLAFDRAADGSLSATGKIATGGRGTGMGLGSQGALALSRDGRWLVAVDAGSNELTSFAVQGTSLQRRSHVSSDGLMPVSVTIHGDLVYTVNAGEPSCITGFRLDKEGRLSPIANSKHSLSAPVTAAAQVEFNPKGDALIVTEKATNVIDTFVVKADGTTSNGEAWPSAGITPFGFAFTSLGHLVVSEAFGGMAGKSAASSYVLDADVHAAGPNNFERGLSAISSSVANGQGAACWVAITNDNRFAFVSNTASANLSTYRLDASGKLELFQAISATTGQGSRPIDIALDQSSRHLYVLSAGTSDVKVFDVKADGSLEAQAKAVTVPATAFGLVAR